MLTYLAYHECKLFLAVSDDVHLLGDEALLVLVLGVAGAVWADGGLRLAKAEPLTH